MDLGAVGPVLHHPAPSTKLGSQRVGTGPVAVRTRVVALPLLPLPVDTTVGAGVGGVAVGVGVGPCTGVVAGPVTVGCPPAPPGAGVHVDGAGVVDVKVG